MNVPPNVAAELSWWDYGALLSAWNEMHSTDKDEQAEAPDSDFVDKFFDRLADAGLVNESVH